MTPGLLGTLLSISVLGQAPQQAVTQAATNETIVHHLALYGTVVNTTEAAVEDEYGNTSRARAGGTDTAYDYEYYTTGPQDEEHDSWTRTAGGAFILRVLASVPWFRIGVWAAGTAWRIAGEVACLGYAAWFTLSSIGYLTAGLTLALTPWIASIVWLLTVAVQCVAWTGRLLGRVVARRQAGGTPTDGRKRRQTRCSTRRRVSRRISIAARNGPSVQSIAILFRKTEWCSI